MDKELIEKLNQLDRIEYKVDLLDRERKDVLPAMLYLAILYFMIVVMVLSLDIYIFLLEESAIYETTTRALVIVGLFFMLTVILLGVFGIYKTTKNQNDQKKKYFSKLKIEAKK